METPKTRYVMLNNPLNPAAVVYPREDLEMLGRICQEHNLIAICDEVWEHVVFDGREHIPLITIPGMRERTVKIGSAGKIFGLTGWKIGFVCAAPHILRVLAHQNDNRSAAARSLGISRATLYEKLHKYGIS